VSLPKGVSLIPAVLNSPEPYMRNHLDRIKEFPLKEDKVLRKPSSIANGGSTWKRRYESRNKILALMMIWCTFQHVFPFKSLLGYLL